MGRDLEDIYSGIWKFENEILDQKIDPFKFLYHHVKRGELGNAWRSF